MTIEHILGLWQEQELKEGAERREFDVEVILHQWPNQTPRTMKVKRYLSPNMVSVIKLKTPKITQVEKETQYNYTQIRCISVAAFSLYNS